MKKLRKGEIGYPLDNSYSKCISNSQIEAPYLAGIHGVEAEKVSIISEPYIKEITTILGKKQDYEFIQVEYKGEQYEILNCFHDSYESMSRRVEFEKTYDY